VEIATERGDPSVANGWRIRAILGGIPGIVVGWFALGPAIVVIAVAVVAIVCGLLVTGPPINLRLYGTTRGATALLHVCSAVERRSGTLDVEPGRLCWTPWKRYESAAKGSTSIEAMWNGPSSSLGAGSQQVVASSSISGTERRRT
jgi:hypothetical protein